jgi:hypothetical protein
MRDLSSKPLMRRWAIADVVILFGLAEIVAIGIIFKKHALHLTSAPRFTLLLLPLFAAAPLASGYIAYNRMRKLLRNCALDQDTWGSLQYHVLAIVGIAYATLLLSLGLLIVSLIR